MESSSTLIRHPQATKKNSGSGGCRPVTFVGDRPDIVLTAIPEPEDNWDPVDLPDNLFADDGAFDFMIGCAILHHPHRIASILQICHWMKEHSRQLAIEVPLPNRPWSSLNPIEIVNLQREEWIQQVYRKLMSYDSHFHIRPMRRQICPYDDDSIGYMVSPSQHFRYVDLSGHADPPRIGSFDFLRLPEDIRYQIYGHVLCFPGCVVALSTMARYCMDTGLAQIKIATDGGRVLPEIAGAMEYRTTQTSDPSERFALLLSCRQIYREAVPFFFGKTKFSFTWPKDCQRFLLRALSRTNHVRHLSTTILPGPGHHWMQQPYLLPDLLPTCNRLQTLVLRFGPYALPGIPHYQNNVGEYGLMDLKIYLGLLQLRNLSHLVVQPDCSKTDPERHIRTHMARLWEDVLRPVVLHPSAIAEASARRARENAAARAATTEQGEEHNHEQDGEDNNVQANYQPQERTEEEQAVIDEYFNEAYEQLMLSQASEL